jgi:hypothetical protein
VYTADGVTLLRRVESENGESFDIAMPDIATYLIAVTDNTRINDGNFNSEQYTLRLLSNDGRQMPVAELEPNDNKDYATEVNFATGTAEMTGQSMDKLDVDWFKISTTSDNQRVMVTYSTTATGAPWTVYITYNDNNNDNERLNTRFHEEYIVDDKYYTVDLESAGDYFFKIAPYNYTASNYKSAQYKVTVETVQ